MLFGRPLVYIHTLWNWKRNENENGHSFSAEKRTWKSSDNISVFFLFFSHIQSPSQPYNAPPIPHPVSPLCRWSLLMAFHFPRVQHIDIFVAFFSRWHFNPWTVCFLGLLLPSESNFPQSTHCALLASVWSKNSPIVKYPLNWGWCAWSAEGSLKQWLQNGKLLLLSLTKCHGVPCSQPSRITAKVLRNCKTFSSRPRPRPRPNVQDQDQDFVIQDQDQDSFLSSRRLETKTLSRGLTSLENYTWNIAYRWWNLGKVNWWHTFELLCIHSYHTFMCYRQQRIT